MRSDQGVNKLNEEEQNLKDFEGSFLANSYNMLMVLANIQDDCKPDIPSKYKSKFNRIVEDIKALQEDIGGTYIPYPKGNR